MLLTYVLLKRFVIKFFEQLRHLSVNWHVKRKEVAQLRWIVFPGEQVRPVQLPSTGAAARQIIFMSQHQGRIWRNGDIPRSVAPTPFRCSWKIVDRNFLSSLLDPLTAPAASIELGRSECQINQCTNTCSCKTKGMYYCAEMHEDRAPTPWSW